MNADRKAVDVLAAMDQAQAHLSNAVTVGGGKAGIDLMKARAAVAELMICVGHARPLLSKYLADRGEELAASRLYDNACRIVDRLDASIDRIGGAK